MLPILYSENTTVNGFLANNGLGFFNRCLKCVVTEERNGAYELEMSILPTDRLAKAVAVGMFIRAKPNHHDNPQIFEIYSVSVDISRIDIKAQHIRYLVNNNVLTESFTGSGTPLKLWDNIQTFLALDNLFTFSTDITTSGTVTAGKDRPITLSEFLSGTSGSVLDVFGGEYYYDNFNISLRSERGTDTGVCLRYGSNISSQKQESNNQSMYSHIMPYAEVETKFVSEDGESGGTLFVYLDPPIEITGNTLAYQKALLYDFTDDMKDTVLIWSSTGTPKNMNEVREQLRQKTLRYVSKNQTALTQISTNITVDTAETLKDLNGCKLCDTVLVYFEPLDVSAKAKIIKTVYNVLDDKYEKIELGKARKTIADLINVKNIGGA